MKKKLISVVIPVYNEVENVPTAYAALVKIAEDLSPKFDFEFLFTDNSSNDGTFETLRKLSSTDSRLKVIRFSRNFGYQRSILTGYINARGDAVIQLDCDLQDPPELIPQFIELWEQGHEVVYGIRRERQESWWMHRLRKLFYTAIDWVSEHRLPRNAGDFRLIDKKIVDVLRYTEDQHPYLRGLIAEIGFRQIGVPYDRGARKKGESKFSMSALFLLATDGVLNHSIVPLRFATFTGLALSVMTAVGIIIYSIGKIWYGKEWPAGFATTTVLILLSISLNAIFLGIIGEYLGRIYRQVKKRPLTIVEQHLNLD